MKDTNRFKNLSKISTAKIWKKQYPDTLLSNCQNQTQKGILKVARVGGGGVGMAFYFQRQHIRWAADISKEILDTNELYFQVLKEPICLKFYT